MSFDLIIEHDLKRVSGILRQMAGETDALMDKILVTASNYELRQQKKRFTTLIDPEGVPWKPLRSLTKKGRKLGKGRGGKGSKPLSSTGQLKKNIVAERTGERDIRIRANSFYAKWQQRGFQSVITGKQAWWMVINLFGYDPKNPWKFAREAFGKDQSTKKPRSRKKKKKETLSAKMRKDKELLKWARSQKKKKKSKEDSYKRKQMNMYGVMMAKKFWQILVGSTLKVPARRFMGIASDDIPEIEKIAVRHIEAYIKRVTKR